MTYYLSGPMSGYHEFNYPAFEHAASRLRGMGYDVRSPHLIDPGVRVLSWAEHLRADLTVLLQCDAIVMLPGWPESRGARLEIQTALSLDMPVYYFTSDNMIDMNRSAP